MKNSVFGLIVMSTLVLAALLLKLAIFLGTVYLACLVIKTVLGL